MRAPEKVPAKGFYYHYKHNREGKVNDYAYEVIGVGVHTETEDTYLVIYRPLYESSVYWAGKLFDLRPLEMWMGTVTKDDQTFPRFELITDPDIIAQLDVIRSQMYR